MYAIYDLTDNNQWPEVQCTNADDDTDNNDDDTANYIKWNWTLAKSVRSE